MGKNARLRRERKAGKKQNDPFYQLALKIFNSGDKMFNRDGLELHYNSVEDIEALFQKSAALNDVDKLERIADELIRNIADNELVRTLSNGES
jgi:hypothetical protein